MKKSLALLISSLIFCFSGHLVFTQGINGYASVTAIAGNTITINNVNELDDTFEDGEYIIIMQMQDDVIGNLTNSASFGILGSIQSAGLYEVKQISSHTESAGLPTTITISGSIANSYNFNANATVQIITFPSFGSPNYTTTANMSPPAWNGNIGGVLAFEVPGTLTLAHNISANSDGFRGGANDNAAANGGCEDNIYISVNSARAHKGEGIYKNTNSAYEAAKGKMLNGGGGGSSHNGGGGGGGNFTIGGEGGVGWSCSALPGQTAGGQGGIDLSLQITSSRLFMGGGGGAGERNNAYVTAGGAGGGILIIKANEITTAGTCGGLSISANGETKPNIGNDGAPGGGAGGSIFLDVNFFNVVLGCLLTIEANGGVGASAITGSVHGGGGGGGQGVVIFTILQPITNIITNTIGGIGGCNNNSSPCISWAGSGGGIPGLGIIPSLISGPLPVQLSYFNAEVLFENEVSLSWETKSETDNDHFIVERSLDGNNWYKLTKLEGAGSSSESIVYNYIDSDPFDGLSYYRLSQIDFNGDVTEHGIKSVQIKGQSSSNFMVYPNPSSGQFYIKSENSNQLKHIWIKNMQGQSLVLRPVLINGMVQVDVSQISKGIYILFIERQNGKVETKRIILK